MPFVGRTGWGVALLLSAAPALAQTQARPAAIAATRSSDGRLRALDAQVDQMLRSGDLRVREVVPDALVPDVRHERLDQYYRGVRIVGGDVTRQIAADGTVSVFGMVHSGVDLDVAARLRELELELPGPSGRLFKLQINCPFGPT